jgi:hypothetical protein
MWLIFGCGDREDDDDDSGGKPAGLGRCDAVDQVALPPGEAFRYLEALGLAELQQTRTRSSNLRPACCRLGGKRRTRSIASHGMTDLADLATCALVAPPQSIRRPSTRTSLHPRRLETRSSSPRTTPRSPRSLITSWPATPCQDHPDRRPDRARRRHGWTGSCLGRHHLAENPSAVDDVIGSSARSPATLVYTSGDRPTAGAAAGQLDLLGAAVMTSTSSTPTTCSTRRSAMSSARRWS